MSNWTYITGTITAEPMGRTQSEKRYILETVLNHLPLVTGSEGDMETYIIQKKDTNCSSSCDEYGDHTNNLIDRYGNHSYKSGWLKIQEDYIIVLDAALRDRELDETYREFMKWLCRLAKRVRLDDILVRIDDYNKSITINDKCDIDSPYFTMYEWPSWCKESGGEPAWWEHLMWNRMKNCDYPILLGYKYFADPENDAEAERRLHYR